MNIVRYFYRRETNGNLNRVFTIAYTYNRETGEAVYGASVFRQDSKSEPFVKSHHRHTAEMRRQKCPVTISVAGGTWNQIEDTIRNAIRVHGVKGSR